MGPVNLTLHFDGGCSFNPGGAMRFGWVLTDDDGRRWAEASGPVDGYPFAERSCNTAEFTAALAGLEWVAALRFPPIDTLTVRGDSRLVVEILNRRWQARKDHLRVLADRCAAALADIDAGHIEVVWVPREQNAEADRLAGAK